MSAGADSPPDGKAVQNVLMRIAVALLLSFVVAAAAAGCGEDNVSQEEAQAELGIDLGAPINLANCSDWQQGDVSQRLGTIRELEEFLGGPTGSPGTSGATLEEDDAYQLFENFCEQEYARGFKLYKLYSRAASFGGPIPEN
jgi:hypothetical protein